MWVNNKHVRIHEKILLMEEILHQLIGSLPQYLQTFLHPRWCRISSINSIAMWKLQTSQEPYDINEGTLSDCFFPTFQSNNSIQFLVQDQTKNPFPAVPIPFPPPLYLSLCKLPILGGSNHANVWWIWVIVHCLGWYYGWWKKSCTNW